MRGEIRTAILIVLDLVLPAGNDRMSSCIDIYVNGVVWGCIPFIEADGILNKQQRLVWQKQGARRCSEIDSGEHETSRCCKMG